MDFARDGVEDANRRTALHPINFVENYVSGDAHVVLKFSTGTNAGKFESVLVCVPPHEKFRGIFHKAGIVEVKPGCRDRYRNEQTMFVGVTKFVQRPKRIIPGLVWIKGTEQISDCFGQIFASTFDNVSKLGGSVGEGEIGIFRLFDSAEECGRIPALVKRRSKMFNGVASCISPTWRDWPRKLKAMNRPTFRVYFLSTGRWCFCA